MAESDSQSSDSDHELSEEYSSKIRSLNNDVRVNVQFSNRRGRTASLLWYNFKGVFVKYAILHNNDCMDMYTYETHPWGARDVTTGDVLNIGGQSVYYPQAPVDGDDENKFPQAYIDLPLYSLKEICLQQVQKLYSKRKITTIADLLPRTPVTDLKEGGRHEVHHLYQNMKVSKGSHVEHTFGEDGLVKVVNLDEKNIPMGDHQLPMIVRRRRRRRPEQVQINRKLNVLTHPLVVKIFSIVKTKKKPQVLAVSHRLESLFEQAID